MLTGTPALPGGARLMFALEFIFLCGSPAELRGSRRGDPARWPNSTPRLSVAPLGRPINRLNPQIAVSSDAHYLAALFFIHLSEFCSSVLFSFSFLDAQSSDAPQTHFYRSLLFVPASVVLKNRGVSVLVDFACQRIIKETTLFLLLFWFSIRMALHLSCRHAALPQREGDILLFYWHSLHLLTNTLTYFMKLYFSPQNNVRVHFFTFVFERGKKDIYI